MVKQTVQGKGFEYACLKTFFDVLVEKGMVVSVLKNKPFSTAEMNFQQLSSKLQKDMLLAARASVKTIINSEPNLTNGTEEIQISLAEDKQGAGGDVRDVIFLKNVSGWEIGVSCKHNHHALKHSRLSQKIDFGEKWLGYSVSDTYREKIRPVFTYLEQLKEATKQLDKSLQNKWDMIAKKELTIYKPVLDAFHDELLRLAEEHDDVPSKLIEYLLGRKDFYKRPPAKQNMLN